MPAVTYDTKDVRSLQRQRQRTLHRVRTVPSYRYHPYLRPIEHDQLTPAYKTERQAQVQTTLLFAQGGEGLGYAPRAH